MYAGPIAGPNGVASRCMDGGRMSTGRIRPLSARALAMSGRDG